MVTINGETWLVEELAALVDAARALVRKARPVQTRGGERMAIPERPALWNLMGALDRPGARIEAEQEQGRAA